MNQSFYFLRRAALGLLVSLGLVASAQAQSGSVTTTQSFSYTGQIVTWQVPTGVTSLTIEARGGEGGKRAGNAGKGAIIRSAVMVTPGQQLSVLVGGAAGDDFLGGGAVRSLSLAQHLCSP